MAAETWDVLRSHLVDIVSFFSHGFGDFTFDVGWMDQTIEALERRLPDRQVEWHLNKRRSGGPFFDWWTDPRIDHDHLTAQWQQLLSLDSHMETRMCFWDAGTLEFLVRTDDLDAGDFTAGFVCVSSS